KEPLPLLDLNLPDITLNELDQLFEEFPEIKQQNNNENSIVDCTKNLYSLIHCTKIFHQEEYPTTIVPLSVLIPSTTTMMNEDIQKQIPSPTNSSSRSTVVRSPSSSDVESPNELLLPQNLLSHDKLKQTMDEYIIQKINENQLNIEQEDKNDQTPTEKG
ncbi:unnamed protein product, partial [Rotaria sp. Silwood1]